jgi:hypothetical protein
VEVNEPANWNVRDPCPGVDLALISPVSLRALALFARSLARQAVQGEFIRLYGVVDMLGALDYHYGNLTAIRTGLDKHVQAASADLKPGGHVTLDPQLTADLCNDSDFRLFTNAKYEATAYLGRLGQVGYFAKSSFVTSRIGCIATLVLDRLVVFRHKFSAHRSIDKPSGESPELQTLQAMSLSNSGGVLLHPLSNGRKAVGFQIRTRAGGQTFVPEEDHPRVMDEAYSVFSRVLGAPQRWQRA